MARGRFLSKSIAYDKRLNSLSDAAIIAYFFAIPHLDVDGCITGDPFELHLMTCPAQPYGDVMADIINEWSTSGLVVVYEYDSTPALFFCGFPKNQKISKSGRVREAESKYGVPPGYERNEDTMNLQRIGNDNSTTTHGVDNEDAALRVKNKTNGSEEEEQVQDKPSSSFIRDEQRLINLLRRNNISHDYLDVEHALKGGATPEWIEEAITIAVGNGKTHWPYVVGIINNWKEKGRKKEQDNGNGKYDIPDELKGIIKG